MDFVKSRKQPSNSIRTIFLFSIISLLILPLYTYNTNTIAAENNEWNIKINLSSEDGSYDYVVFGENSHASDGPPNDDYDKPKPPPPIFPYIRSWFNDGLSEPYNVLLEDYRKSQDSYKIWNLSVMWVSSDNNLSDITFSWDIENKTSIEYGNIRLYEKGKNSPLSDLLDENSYTTPFIANEIKEFQIICENSTSNPVTEDNDNTFLLIIAIIVIAIIALLVFFWKIKG